MDRAPHRTEFASSLSIYRLDRDGDERTGWAADRLCVRLCAHRERPRLETRAVGRRQLNALRHTALRTRRRSSELRRPSRRYAPHFSRAASLAKVMATARRLCELDHTRLATAADLTELGSAPLRIRPPSARLAATANTATSGVPPQPRFGARAPHHSRCGLLRTARMVASTLPMRLRSNSALRQTTRRFSSFACS